MSKSSLAVLMFVCCLLLSTPVQADTAGIRPGTSFSYSYDIVTTYKSPNGNVTSETTAVFQISVTSVNTSGSVGQFGYTESVVSLNGTIASSGYPETNFSTIFNPYDNESYFGNLGFWPVINTDVQPGSVRNLVLSHSYTYYNGTVYKRYDADVLVNFTVSRSGGLIDVDLWERTLPVKAHQLPLVTRMEFNATTGVMTGYAEYTNLFSIVEKEFFYNLVSISIPVKTNYTWVAYVALGFVAVVAAVGVVRRKSKQERKKERLKEKFGH